MLFRILNWSRSNPDHWKAKVYNTWKIRYNSTHSLGSNQFGFTTGEFFSIGKWLYAIFSLLIFSIFVEGNLKNALNWKFLSVLNQLKITYYFYHTKGMEHKKTPFTLLTIFTPVPYSCSGQDTLFTKYSTSHTISIDHTDHHHAQWQKAKYKLVSLLIESN